MVFVLDAVAGGARSAEYTNLGEVRRAIAEGETTRRRIGGGVINVVIADAANAPDRTEVFEWIDRSAEAVIAYFGRFPVEEVSILIVPEAGRRVGHATTWGYGGSTIRVFVGREADRSVFRDDWVMVHEMTHLALPRLPPDQVWALEGSATYIEPIARVLAGQLDPGKVWKDMARDMPQGLPRASDGGLDQTHSWGRTYWGGALFYFLADIEIRQRTDNQASLQDAMRAVNRAGGGNGVEWTMEQLIAVGDGATGVHALADLYALMGGTPASIDLDGVFASLGVPTGAGDMRFNDAAPLNAIRKALMTASAPKARPDGD